MMVTRISCHFYFGCFIRSWVAWVAAHWRNKGHQRNGYPHSCPKSSNIFWGNQFFLGCSWFEMLVVIEKGKGKGTNRTKSFYARDWTELVILLFPKCFPNKHFSIPLQTAVFTNSFPVLRQVMLKSDVLWDVRSWEAGKKQSNWVRRSVIVRINVKAISAYWYRNSIKKQNEIMFSYLRIINYNLLTTERDF